MNKEDSNNSHFCTPASQPTCSPEKHPLISRVIRKHWDETGCIVGLQKTMETWRKSSHRPQHENRHRSPDDENTEHVEQRSRRSTLKRASVHSRLDYARRLVNPEVNYEEEQEQDEEESGADTFEALTLEEGMLISSSSENIVRLGQTHGDRKDAYRKIVEKLIKNTGILCKNDMDKLQRKYFRKVVSDFRRQVVPRPLNYNAGGTLERYEV